MLDSADLPLNISRQTLQQDRHVKQIRKWLTKKVLDLLAEMFEKDYDDYLKFWGQFGRALKEGVSSDYENKERILLLLLFQSSADPEKLTTLKGYVDMCEKMYFRLRFYLSILFLTGSSVGVYIRI